MQKFLIIQTAFIGDVVLATVIIEKLHHQFPEAQIDFLVRKGAEGLLQEHPYLNVVYTWNKKGSKWKNLYRIIRQIRNRKYDKVINLQRFFATGLITVLSGAKETIGFDKNPLSAFYHVKIHHCIGTAQNYDHETDRNLKLVAHFTDPSPVSMRLYPRPADEEIVKPLKRHSYICVAPASVWFTKQFPKEKWIEFLKRIPVHYHIYFLGAPADKDLCNEIIATLKDHTCINTCGQFGFLASAALMRDAVMNYVNDSAPLHFASAMNAPVTAVFCSTVPYFGFGPKSNQSFIVQIPEELPCKPCGLHGYKACPLGHFKCAWNIQPEQLLQTIEL